MDCSRVCDEVLARPRIASEELRRKKIAFEAVARPAREHDVALHVCAAMRERVNVIERREIEFQMRAAIDAAAAAIAHGRTLDGALLVAREKPFAATSDSGGSGEGDSVEMPTS